MPDESLWGEDFVIEPEKEKVKQIREKITKPKESKVAVEKQVKSKKISLEDKLKLITEEVLRVLGKQKENIICIKDKQTFHDYITKSIQNGRIDIDTETNNSLDAITCKIAGLCIYTPGEKQAYIPVNHRDPITKERFDWQVTEQDIKEELERLIQIKKENALNLGWSDKYNRTYEEWYNETVGGLETAPRIIMHNGKFDYKILKKTCNVIIKPDWDTMIACKLIDENEFSAGLKQQYISKIDSEQEKYDIEGLFEGVEYVDVDPEVFCYYAATDAMMTDKMYEYQLPILSSADYHRIYNEIFLETEMPDVTVTGEMELQGVCLDKIYAGRLQTKYHKQLEDLDIKLVNMLTELKPKIDLWKLTEEATQAQKKKQTQKQYDRAKESPNFDPTLWSNIKGEWYKVSKAKVDQLDEELTPTSLASPQQLGIILYDILKCPIVNKEKPYATGEDELTKLSEKQPLCKLMLEKRALDKLLNAFIDSLPEKVNIDGRIHGNFNQYGAATGRFSSSEPNLQQVPSHCKEVRMLFCGDTKYLNVESNENEFEILHTDEVNTLDGWKLIKNLKVDKDLIELEENNFYKINSITFINEIGDAKIILDFNNFIQQIPTEG